MKYTNDKHNISKDSDKDDFDGEESKQFYKSTSKRLSKIFMPFGNRITYLHPENIIEQGSNLIVANHPGVGKDIIALIKLYKRQLFFTPRKEMFDKNELTGLLNAYLDKHLTPKGFEVPGFINLLLSPLSIPVINYIVNNINQTEMISLDARISEDKEVQEEIKRNNIRGVFKAIRYVLNERAVLVFQYDPHHHKSQFDSYLHKFNGVASSITYVCAKKDKIIPITPIAIYRGHGLNPFERIVLNVGEPMDITPFMDYAEKEVKEKFTLKLEERTAELLSEAKEVFYGKLEV